MGLTLPLTEHRAVIGVLQSTKNFPQVSCECCVPLGEGPEVQDRELLLLGRFRKVREEVREQVSLLPPGFLQVLPERLRGTGVATEPLWRLGLPEIRDVQELELPLGSRDHPQVLLVDDRGVDSIRAEDLEELRETADWLIGSKKRRAMPAAGGSGEDPDHCLWRNLSVGGR